ncbi:hypothetical protein M3Y99_01083400 [Aphelenchoides fujianensis]|nr:hypothetical protein M3Y99_01083400 [Aphelenchoides fujianensis]
MSAMKIALFFVLLAVLLVEMNALKCHVGYEKLPALHTTQDCTEPGSTACIVLTSHHDKSKFASCEHSNMCKGKAKVETDDFTVQCCRTALCNKI